MTLTVDPSCQVLLPHGRGDFRRRFLRDGEVSGQTTAEPPEGAHRRRWPLGGGARRYARDLRPVERDLRPSTAPADYGEAS